MSEQEDIICYLHNYNQEQERDDFRIVSLFGSYARGEK